MILKKFHPPPNLTTYFTKIDANVILPVAHGILWPLSDKLVTNEFLAILEVFTAMKINVAVCWVVTPCSVVVGYRRFRSPCCLHLHPEGGSVTRLEKTA
jgi:hypothetical protein